MQQNASVSEQMASMAENLSSQAETLQETVHFFHLQESGFYLPGGRKKRRSFFKK